MENKQIQDTTPAFKLSDFVLISVKGVLVWVTITSIKYNTNKGFIYYYEYMGAEDIYSGHIEQTELLKHNSSTNNECPKEFMLIGCKFNRFDINGHGVIKEIIIDNVTFYYNTECTVTGVTITELISLIEHINSSLRKDMFRYNFDTRVTRSIVNEVDNKVKEYKTNYNSLTSEISKREMRGDIANLNQYKSDLIIRWRSNLNKTKRLTMLVKENEATLKIAKQIKE